MGVMFSLPFEGSALLGVLLLPLQCPPTPWYWVWSAGLWCGAVVCGAMVYGCVVSRALVCGGVSAPCAHRVLLFQRAYP